VNARELLESENVIKANPLLRTLRNGRRLVLILLMLLLTLQASFFALDIIYHHGVFVAKDAITPFGFGIVLFALMPIIYTYQERYWKRIEHQRFAAARGEYTLLAAEQPWPEEVPTFLSLFVELRRSREFFLLMTALESPLALLMASYFTEALILYNDLSLFSSNPFLVFFVLFLLFALIPLAVAFFALRSSGQELTVTEDGMTVHDNHQVHVVKWQEARLFAMYGTFGKQKSGTSITYELSSARDIVRWTWVLRRTWSPGLEPTIPQDEYNRQMQALLSFVVARTGLPLYDLREDLPRGGPKD
jgi:hypothetical protein